MWHIRKMCYITAHKGKRLEAREIFNSRCGCPAKVIEMELHNLQCWDSRYIWKYVQITIRGIEFFNAGSDSIIRFPICTLLWFMASLWRLEKLISCIHPILFAFTSISRVTMRWEAPLKCSGKTDNLCPYIYQKNWNWRFSPVSAFQ